MKKTMKVALMVILVLMAVWGVLKTVKYPYPLGKNVFYNCAGIMKQYFVTGTYCGTESDSQNCIVFEVQLSPTLADLITPSCPNDVTVLGQDERYMEHFWLKKGTCELRWVHCSP